MKIASLARRAAALHLLAALGCAPEQPRIIATFRQGTGEYNYSPKLGAPYYYYNPPTLVGGHVYIGTSRKHGDRPADQNWFFKLDAGLKKVWQYELGSGEVRGAATLDPAGNVYFVAQWGRTWADGWTDYATSRAYLISLTNDGAFRWQLEISPPGTDDGMGMFNPAVGADGTIYVGGARFWALGSDGSVQWVYDAGWTITNAPIIDPSGNLYFVAGPYACSLDKNGVQRWRVAVGGEGWSSPAFSPAQDRVIVATTNSVVSLDAASGSAHWSFWPPAGGSGDFRATPAVDDVGDVYIGTKDNQWSVFYAIRADGTLKWANPVNFDLYSSPLLGSDRTVYFGSEGHSETSPIAHYGPRFNALDMETGATKWTLQLDGDVNWSSPAMSDKGVVYVGAMNGYVYAIQTDATGLLANAGSARFHEGNASTGRRE